MNTVYYNKKMQDILGVINETCKPSLVHNGLRLCSVDCADPEIIRQAFLEACFTYIFGTLAAVLFIACAFWFGNHPADLLLESIARTTDAELRHAIKSACKERGIHYPDFLLNDEDDEFDQLGGPRRDDPPAYVLARPAGW